AGTPVKVDGVCVVLGKELFGDAFDLGKAGACGDQNNRAGQGLAEAGFAKGQFHLHGGVLPQVAQDFTGVAPVGRGIHVQLKLPAARGVGDGEVGSLYSGDLQGEVLPGVILQLAPGGGKQTNSIDIST